MTRIIYTTQPATISSGGIYLAAALTYPCPLRFGKPPLYSHKHSQVCRKVLTPSVV